MGIGNEPSFKEGMAAYNQSVETVKGFSTITSDGDEIITDVKCCLHQSKSMLFII